MNTTFGITATDHVYRRERHDWVLLGTLSYVMNDPSVIGRDVRDWWKSLIQNDIPLPILLLRDSKLRGPKIPASEAMIVTGLEGKDLKALAGGSKPWEAPNADPRG